MRRRRSSSRQSWIPLALAVVLLAFAPRAGATGFGVSHRYGLPGISLQELLDGGELTSRDGLLTFSDFEADLSDLSDRQLRRLRVVPTRSGLKLLTPLKALHDDSAGIDLHYTVEAAEGYAIEGAGLLVKGLALGDASAGATKSFGELGDLSAVLGETSCLGDDFYRPLGKSDEGWDHHSGGGLDVRDLLGHVRDQDFLRFDEPQAFLDVWESAFVESGGRFGIALLPFVINKFKLVPVAVPEPGTVWLLGCAAIAIALGARRR
jgi:hypothetical protein